MINPPGNPVNRFRNGLKKLGKSSPSQPLKEAVAPGNKKTRKKFSHTAFSRWAIRIISTLKNIFTRKPVLSSNTNNSKTQNSTSARRLSERSSKPYSKDIETTQLEPRKKLSNIERLCQSWAFEYEFKSDDKLAIQKHLYEADNVKFKQLCKSRIERLKSHLSGGLIYGLANAAVNLFLKDANKEELKQLSEELENIGNDQDTFLKHLESFEDKLGIFSLRKILDAHHFNIDRNTSLFEIHENTLAKMERNNLLIAQARIKTEKNIITKTKNITKSITSSFIPALPKRLKKPQNIHERQVSGNQYIIDDIKHKISTLKQVAEENRIPPEAFIHLTPKGLSEIIYENYPESMLILLETRLELLEKDIDSFSRARDLLPKNLGGGRKAYARNRIARLKDFFNKVDTNTPEALRSFLSELESYEKEFEKISLNTALSMHFLELPGSENIAPLEVQNINTGFLPAWLIAQEQKDIYQEHLRALDFENYQEDITRYKKHVTKKPLIPTRKEYTAEHVFHAIEKNPRLSHKLIVKIIHQEYKTNKKPTAGLPEDNAKSIMSFIEKPENSWIIKALQTKLIGNNIIDRMAFFEPQHLCDILIRDCSSQLLKNHSPHAAHQLSQVLTIKKRLENEDNFSESDLPNLFSDYSNQEEAGSLLKKTETSLARDDLIAFINNPENSGLICNATARMTRAILSEINDHINSVDPENADQATLTKALHAKKMFHDLKAPIDDELAVEKLSENIENKCKKIQAALGWFFIAKEQHNNHKKIYFLKLPDKQDFIKKATQPTLAPSTQTALFRTLSEYAEHLIHHVQDQKTEDSDSSTLEDLYFEIFTLQEEKIHKETEAILEKQHNQKEGTFTSLANQNQQTLATGNLEENIKLLKKVYARQTKIAPSKPVKSLLKSPGSTLYDTISALPLTQTERLEDLEHKKLLLELGYNYKDELISNVKDRVVPRCLRFWEESSTTTDELSTSNDQQRKEISEKQGEVVTGIYERILKKTALIQKVANRHPKFRELCGNAIIFPLITMRMAGIPIPIYLNGAIQAAVQSLGTSFAGNHKPLSAKNLGALSDEEKKIFKDIQFLHDSCSMIMMPVLGAYSLNNFCSGITTFAFKKMIGQVPNDKVHEVISQLAAIVPSITFCTEILQNMFGDISALSKGKTSLLMSAGKALVMTLVTPFRNRYNAITEAWRKRHIQGWKPFWMEVGKIAAISFISVATVGFTAALTALTYGTILPVIAAIPQLLMMAWTLTKAVETVENYTGILGMIQYAYTKLYGSEALKKKEIKKTCNQHIKLLMPEFKKSKEYLDSEEMSVLQQYYKTYLEQYYNSKENELGSHKAFKIWQDEQETAIKHWLNSQRNAIDKQASIISNKLKALNYIEQRLKSFNHKTITKQDLKLIQKKLASYGIKTKIQPENILQQLFLLRSETASYIEEIFGQLPQDNPGFIRRHLEQRMREIYVGALIKMSAVAGQSMNKFESKVKKHFEKTVERKLFKKIDAAIDEHIILTADEFLNSKDKGHPHSIEPPPVATKAMEPDESREPIPSSEVPEALENNRRKETSSDETEALKSTSEYMATTNFQVAKEHYSHPGPVIFDYTGMDTDDDDETEEFFDAVETLSETKVSESIPAKTSPDIHSIPEGGKQKPSLIDAIKEAAKFIS